MIKKFSTNNLRSSKKKRKRSSRKKRPSKKLNTNKKNEKSTQEIAAKKMKPVAESNDNMPFKNVPTRNLALSVDGSAALPEMAPNSNKINNAQLTPPPTAHNNQTLTIIPLTSTDSLEIIEDDDGVSAADADANNNITVPNVMHKTPSIQIEDATETLTLDDRKFDEELEGDEDRFQLQDIVWSITHKDNTDKEARSIILLTFPTFSNDMKLLKCLIERFFASDGTSSKDNSSRRDSLSASVESESNTATTDTLTESSATVSKFDSYFMSGTLNVHRIESIWEVQIKVISFIQHWMRTYWAEDWDGNEKLLDFVEQFCDKIENGYKNDPTMDDKDVKKGMKLIKMIHQTMDFQEATLRKIDRSKSLRQQSSPHNKFDRIMDVNSSVSKMRYDFVKISNERLAEQITLLDFKLFASIQKRECLGQSWKKKNKYEIAKNICALIDQFNRMSKWVQATILLATNVKKRGRLIKKFIKIANELLMLRNFQSLCAFHGALTSVPIHKLKTAWSYVPAKHIARFEEMRVIFNTRGGMANLRKLHREAHAPLVPYTGIFLSDLVSIEEGHKKKKDDGSVNFAKLMRLNSAIDGILIYQRTPYEIGDDPAIQNLLLEDFKTNEKLDADYIYTFSAVIAKQDMPMKKKSMLSLFGGSK